jgi:hypothetical protein
MQKKEIPNMIPYLILLSGFIYSCLFKKGEVQSNLKEQVAGASLIINLVIYFIRFKYGILVTGVLLILSIFQLLKFFSIEIIFNNSFQIKDTKLHFPQIELLSLVLTVLYFYLNIRYLNILYNDFKRS